MRYVPALDGIRALAVGLVLCFHAGVPGMRSGSFGVDVFFVLSGYLITQILAEERERTGTIDLRRFYVRRLRRLWPALLAMLAVFLAVAPWLFTEHPMRDHVRDALLSAFYLADYARMFGAPPVVLDHMWSLAVEEQFYLAWPLLLLGLMQLPQRWALAAVAGLFVGLTLWRMYVAHDIVWGIYHRFDTHAAGLALGCLVGLAKARLPERYFWLGAAALALAMYEYSHGTKSTAMKGFTVVELAAVVIVMSQPKWLGVAPLAWVGRMSYGLYLWHYPIVRVCREFHLGWEESLAVSALGGLAMAALSYYTIEAYFRRPSLTVDGQLQLVDVPVQVSARGAGGVVDDVQIPAPAGDGQRV